MLAKFVRHQLNDDVCVLINQNSEGINIYIYDNFDKSYKLLGTLSSGKWVFPNVVSRSKFIQLSKEYRSKFKRALSRFQTQHRESTEIIKSFNCLKRRIDIKIKKVMNRLNNFG